MNKPLHEDGLGAKGFSANTFAELHGLSIDTVTRYCRQGRIFGARKHPLTKKWWIYPPAKLLCGVETKRVDTSTPMRSTLLENAQD